MKKLLSFLTLLLLANWAYAQNPKSDNPADYRPFSHIDAGFTIGTSGFGFDLASPMGPHLDLRVGFTFVPPVGFTYGYDMLMGEREDLPSEQEVAEMDKMCKMLQDLTNTRVNRFVDVQHSAHSYNGKILLDWFPLRDRNFHVTAGLFIGSAYMGYATTMPNEGATMVGINMYNALYDQCLTLDEFEYPTIKVGDYSIALDPAVGQEVKDRLLALGRLEMSLGRYSHDILDAEGNVIHREGDVHYITPNDEGVIRMEIKTHVVKPYLGLGYNAYLGREKRWNIGCDLGMVILGQCPHIIGEDGVCLTHDVRDIGGYPGKYVGYVKAFPVYPLLEFKTAYRIL